MMETAALTLMQPNQKRTFGDLLACCLPSDVFNPKTVVLLHPEYLTKQEIVEEQLSLRDKFDRRPLLDALPPEVPARLCLVLDLDETLVHSSFQKSRRYDAVLPFVVDGVAHNIYTTIRPGCSDFLKQVGARYEIIIYTASLGAYAKSIVRLIDTDSVVSRVLCRRDCVCLHAGVLVKDLRLLQRPLNRTLLVDNAPSCALLQPANSIIVNSFIDDQSDNELPQLARFLLSLENVPDVRLHTRNWRKAIAAQRRNSQQPLQAHYMKARVRL